MKKNITSNLLVLIIIFIFSIACSKQEASFKSEISVQGYAVKVPRDWEMDFVSLDGKARDTGILVASPNLDNFRSGGIKKGIYFHYLTRDFPHETQQSAFNELKLKNQNQDVKLVTINSREWLLWNTKNEYGDLSFAQTLMAPKKYVLVRGENLNSEQELTQFLTGITFPQ